MVIMGRFSHLLNRGKTALVAPVKATVAPALMPCFTQVLFKMGVMVIVDLQWNLSNTDTIGAEESVLIREVSSFQGLKCI